mmetsp:Transcript_24965/g.69380  ORF Transcript_24965/g.69380 Transcript_24965/m.69380 type:complete len:221 (-) Transcript_24965:60-722(-)
MHMPCHSLELLGCSIAAEFLEHGEHIGRAGAFRKVIAGRIAGSFGELDRRDDAVLNDERESLAAVDESETLRAVVRELHVEGPRDDGEGIRHERDEAVVWDLLIVGPGLHDGAVVDAVDDDLVHASLLECVLIVQITRDLDVGSGGREGTRQSHDDDRLAGDVVGKVDRLGWEALVEVQSGGDDVAHLHGVDSGGAGQDADQQRHERGHHRCLFYCYYDY